MLSDRRDGSEDAEGEPSIELSDSSLEKGKVGFDVWKCTLWSAQASRKQGG